MNIFGLFSLLMAVMPLIKSIESGEYYNYLELEKAQIRNKEQPKAASPGQLIAFVPAATAATTTQAAIVEETKAPKPVTQSEEKKSKPTETASSDDKNKNSKKDKPNGSSTGSGKEKKKASQDQDDDDDINKLPKRLFRPRFRAENSAESISMSSTMLTLAISAIMILFI